MYRTAVMCAKGHVFWRTWVVGASLTTIRLGPRRIGWCRAGRHVSVLRRADTGRLTAEQRAALYGDG
ncbi:hypothetical protein [Actinacidiphila reveromycinica]|nr:hypothetical protein [Streptomyces sp. SN-593]